MSSVIKQAAPVVQDARRRVGFRARAGAVSAGAFDGAPADPARPCQMIAMAEAMNTLEYVPVTMPTIIVNANPCSTSPPKKNSASALSSAVPGGDDRAAHRLVDREIDDVVERVPRRMLRMFSRTRSKMTIVSLVE